MVEVRAVVLLQERGQPSRRFGAEQLPLALGDTSADIVVAGVDAAAQLGFLDGRFYVQGDRQRPGFRLNHELVQGSQWLVSGDEIAVANVRFRCTVAGLTLTLEMERLSSVGDTDPPEEQTAASDDDDAIVPLAFRAEATEQATGGGWNRAHSLVAAAFSLLALLGWFAFTAKSVALQFTPVPDDLELPGTLMKLQLADRFLLRSGEHRIVAEKTGYYSFETTIQVGQATDQVRAFNLVKLPGRVTLTTEPVIETAEVSVDGQVIGLLGSDSIELAAGIHQLELRAPRFITVVSELEVAGEGSEQSLNFTLRPDWAAVTLATDPPGAQVQVDGEALGVTPLKMELTAGQRSIEARLPGFNAWEQDLEVVAGEAVQIPMVQLERADGRVWLATVPSGAAIAVNGGFRGRTPATVTLAPGRRHTLTVSKPGYQSQSRTLSVAADSGRRLTLELAAEVGRVTVQTDPAHAQLMIDGKLQTDEEREFTLTAISHRFEAKAEGFSAAKQTVTPRPGFPQQLVLKLDPLVETVAGRFASTVEAGDDHVLRLVLPVEFTMGSSRREEGRRSNEILRRVRLTRPVYVGEREVTNAQFRRFMPDHDSAQFSGVSLNGDDQPVVGVTWEDAVQFCNWLSIQDGLQPVYEPSGDKWVAALPVNRNGYRLPTEAEWAYVARYAGAAQPRRFPWGNDLPPPDRAGNFADLSARAILNPTLVTYSDGFPVSAQVAQFQANPLGFYDLGGNVAEWVHDPYDVTPSAPNEVIDDPMGRNSGRYHVIRGASYKSATVAQLRLSHRDYRDDAREDIGFRIARGGE
jgi:formylglycine-generating enzyme required for sulfatase activity